MNIFTSIFQWFVTHPIKDFGGGDFSDLLAVLIIGAFTGLTRVIYEQIEKKKNGGAKRWLLGIMLGAVGAIMGSEISDILFQDARYTWLLACVVAWSGAELLDMITGIFKNKIESASDMHEMSMQQDIAREHKQRVELDVIEHKADIQKAIDAMNEEHPDELVEKLKDSNDII